jgi:CheY-like chemotaxis protein
MPTVGPLARRCTLPGIEFCQVLEFADTGVGMAGETKERIFEPFFTTKDPGRGTGLGMSIAFSVARRHGGFIDVESQLAKGTTFSIYLPIRPVEQEKVEGKKPVCLSSGRNETILVVEDDAGVRALVREALDEARRAEHISLVVTDVVMPEMSGRDMWEHLTNEGFDVPLIVMSGFPEEKDVHKLSSCASTYLQKPFSPQEISRAVRATLDSFEEQHTGDDA